MTKEGVDWYFISFRNPDTNTNLGCCNVSVKAGGGQDAALRKTHQLKINPGGEVAMFLTQAIEPGWEENKLYSREEMKAMKYEKINN